MAVNTFEKRFVNPIMKRIQERNYLPLSAYKGFDAVEVALHEQGVQNALYFMSADYTGMDQTMGPHQMELVYNFLAPMFQPIHRAELYRSMMHATRIPILIDRNQYLTGDHGLASGSG